VKAPSFTLEKRALNEHKKKSNPSARTLEKEREREGKRERERDMNDHAQQQGDEDGEEKATASTGGTETRSIFSGSNHTYSDHSSSDEEEDDFASVGDYCAGGGTNQNQNKSANNDNSREYDGEESEYYEPRDSLSQFSGSDRHLAEVLDRQLSALGQSCADENSLDPEDLKAPSVQTDPTNPNNDILNSDMEEGASGGGTPRGIEAELRDPTKFTLKNLDTGAEYLVGEEAANALLHKKKKAESGGGGRKSEDRENVPTVTDLTTGTVMSVVEMERNVAIEAVTSPILNEVERRERLSMKEGDGDDDSKTKQKPTTSTTTKDLGDKKTTAKPRNPGRWLKKRSTEAWNKTKEVSKIAAEKIVETKSHLQHSLEERKQERRAQEEENSLHHGQSLVKPGCEEVGQYLKVHVNRKGFKDFSKVKVIQSVKGHEGAVWCMKFSRTGKFLATAGQDRIVRVWTIQCMKSEAPENADTSENYHEDGEIKACSFKKRGESMFKDVPLRAYVGHKGDVLDLCWSHTDWLLSSSMDKTVRLWYTTMNECLRIFAHQDFVTAIDFNPVNDKYFVSGSLDGKLRLWNIPDHRVVDWVDIGEMVTAACFQSDGQCVVAGSYRGKCHFYQTVGFKFEYLTLLDIQNRRQRNPMGKKVTGLQFFPGDDRKLLVASNDSRLRIYDGYQLKTKYKGHKNKNSQIKATFSERGDFIICGSETEYLFVWPTVNTFIPSAFHGGYQKDKHATYETFAAQTDIVTTAVFAPEEVIMARMPENEKDAYVSRRKSDQEEIENLRILAAKELSEQVKKLRMNSEETEIKDGKKSATSSSSRSLKSQASKWTLEIAEAKKACEASYRKAAGLGQIIVTAGYSGEIRIFENEAGPEQMSSSQVGK